MSRRVALKRVVKVIAGQSPPSNDVEALDGDLPFLQGNAEFGQLHPQPKYQCGSPPKRAVSGDSLLSVRAPVGALNLADRDYGIGRGLAAIRPVAIDSRFLWWSLHAVIDEFRAVATGSTFEAITADDIGAVRIWWPQLEQQREIADFLDSEAARISAVVERRRRLVNLLEERRRSLISRLVIGGDVHGRAAVGALVDVIPRGWEVRRLRHAVAGITVGVVVNPSSYFVDEGIPFLHGSDIREGWIDVSALKYLSPASNEMLSKSKLHAGDVVVVRAGYPGRAAVIPSELDGSNCASILILRRGGLLEPEYLCAFMNSAWAREQVAAAQYGAAQEQINVSDVVDFRVPVPPRDTQRRIVMRISRECESIDRLRRASLRQIDLLRERRKALITAAVNGQLDVPKAVS